MARPRKRLRPEDYTAIQAMAAQGCNRNQIAAAVGLDRKTFALRLNDDPLAADAFEHGRSEEEGALCAILRELAEKGDLAGAASAMFLLRSKFGYRAGARAISLPDREGGLQSLADRDA